MKKIRKGFYAGKRMTVPVKIKFKMKDGKTITLNAKRITTKPVKIKFPFIKKSYK